MKFQSSTNELELKHAIDKYEILNTPPESVFDDLTKLAAQICGTPIALISLCDQDRQWFKSKIGTTTNSINRDIAFCTYAIEQNEVFTIHDASKDERFINNPLVAQSPYMRFYAGAPLIDDQGYALGTLCVIDMTPRTLSEEQMEALKTLARQVMVQLEWRKNLAELTRNAEEKINYLANHDALTELPNKILFKDRLTQALAMAKRNSQPLAVMLLDVDRFKTINDTLGTAVGDCLLQEVAERLATIMGTTETLARFDGNKFAILLPHLRRTEEAAEVCNRILEAIVPAFNIDDNEIFLTLSIGISLYPTDGRDAHTLIRNAGAALCRAKERGGKTYQFYAAEMNNNAIKRMAMGSKLRRVLEREELSLVFQPQVDIQTNRIIGAEALVRWFNPELGMVSPADFIPLAEDTGLIIPIGEWVLRNACKQAKMWHEAGYPQLRIAVNLSARQFQQTNLVLMIAEALREIELDPTCLELELTESCVMKNAELAIGIFQELKGMGIQIAIDDFGTGYSSLSYLKRLPIDRLKIDRSFVNDLTSINGEAIIRAIITLGHSLNLKVTAEGVETEDQLIELAKLTCDEMQGFLFSRPLKPEDYMKLLIEKEQIAHPNLPILESPELPHGSFIV
jgi:diguanylate cyclase